MDDENEDAQVDLERLKRGLRNLIATAETTEARERYVRLLEELEREHR